MNKTVHIHLKLKGKETSQQLFHDIARYLDIDYPYGGGLSRAGSKKQYKECPICKGMIYYNPVLNDKDLRTLARQCNIGVRFKQWKTEETCNGN